MELDSTSAGTLRVLHVCQPLFAGVPNHVAALASRLVAHNVEPIIACPPDSVLATDPPPGSTVLAVPMGRMPRPRRDRAAVGQLRHIIETHAIDLVHTHSAMGGVVGRLAAQQTGTPAVHTPHAWSFWVTTDVALRGLFRGIEGRLQPYTATTICLSEAERSEMSSFRHPSPAVMIPNGMVAPPSFRRRPGGAKIRIGTIARLSEQKGIDVLIHAIDLLDNPDITVTIAGDGPDRRKLQRLAKKLGCDDRIDFVGAVDRPWDTLANLDIFVLPSRWEGMPLVLLEAMVAGVACVATDVGGVSELIPTIDHGRVVPIEDASSLANAIASLAGDPHQRALAGLTAQAHAADNFGPDATVARTADLYRRLVPRTAGTHSMYLPVAQ